MENLISIRTIKVRNFFLNLSVGSISRLENIKNYNIMEVKIKQGYQMLGCRDLIIEASIKLHDEAIAAIKTEKSNRGI